MQQPKHERVQGIETLLRRAAEFAGNNDIMNTAFGVQDRGEVPGVYSACYHKDFPELKRFAGPDFFFWAWPSASIDSFETLRDEMIAASKIPPSIRKVGWFGNLYSPLPDVPEYYTRPLLKQIGDANPDLFDIRHVPPRNNAINEDCENYCKMQDLTKFAFLIDIGGNGYSGRLKLLLFTRRPLLLVDRNYIEYFYDELQPWVHFIPVKMDLSDLMQQVIWAFEHADEASAIAENAFRFAEENFRREKLFARIQSVYAEIRN